jgi:Rnl2 family RNA ligase
MDFLAYAKIPVAGGPGSSGGTWVAQEKIHGAQLVLGASASRVRIGKRKAWLEDADPFFGWQLFRPDLERAGRELFELLRAEAQTLYFYGELFGGHYPHPDVVPVAGVSAVQTGVWYAPGIHWALFDAVRVYDGDRAPDFVAADELAEAAARVGVLTPPALAQGRKNEVAGTPVRFVSKVPELLGLPRIEGNFAEGIVVKHTGSVSAAERGIVKRKIDEFDEKRFDESEAWDSTKPLSLAELVEIAGRLVNEARMASAASKVGRENRDAWLDEVVLDILVDLTEAVPAAVAALSPEDEATLGKRVRAAADRLLPR